MPKSPRKYKPNWSIILHVVEILVIAILGIQQVRLNARVNAEPVFKVEFTPEATQGKVYHIPNVHILIPPAPAFTMPEGFIHRLMIRNAGPLKATRVFVKSTISQGTPFRFALVAVRDDATEAFVPEDEWELHFVDSRAHKYLNISLVQLRQDDQVSIFFGIAYPGKPRSGAEPRALTVVVDAAELRTIDRPTPAVFQIWYGL